jgi:Fe-S cluster biogenesis protein NfuA
MLPDSTVRNETPPQFTECVTVGPAKPDGGGPQEMARRLQDLIEQIQAQPNPAARALLQECLRSILSFYGEGLSRILADIQDLGTQGQDLLERLSDDPAISSLLLIHGLHPVALETRLRRALEKVQPYLRSHGGNIELLSLENEVARVRLEGTCKTCPSSAMTLEFAVRRAVEEACPDLLGFEVMGTVSANNTPANRA